ncbi:hypothetical protein HKBW3S33_01959, partial [Candidatus Hakubella thermalkaliphila]
FVQKGGLKKKKGSDNKFVKSCFFLLTTVLKIAII